MKRSKKKNLEAIRAISNNPQHVVWSACFQLGVPTPLQNSHEENAAKVAAKLKEMGKGMRFAFQTK
jgi:hypothetical protein